MREKARKIAGLMGQMANENRLLILCALLERPMTVGELNQEIPGITMPALSQHLCRLRAGGLVDCSKMVAAVCDKEGKVHLQYTHALAKDGALIGGVWGALIGFLFLNPLLGIVAGAGLGAATGEVGDFGISHRFMNELATHLKPGSSALFIPLKKEAVDETLRALGNSDGVVLSTDLKLEDEYQMEKLFEEMTAERAKKTS